MRRFLGAVTALVMTSGAVVPAVIPAAAAGTPRAPEEPARAPLQTSFEIRSQVNDNCLDVADANPEAGAAVHMWTCNGGANQHWHWVGDQIRSDLNEKCLDLAGANPYDLATVELWDCSFQNNQRFGWDGTFFTTKADDRSLYMGNIGLGSPVLAMFPSSRWNQRYARWTLRPV
ncbi:RICIN domain-containing protein [Streptomyces sp. NPDC093225]|uniref:RICIN domain-containing protein n=1 Tax=Streptomyces sp. NPDC093225 TaxID=3366034 RepID=UPI0038055E63